LKSGRFDDRISDLCSGEPVELFFVL